MVLTETANVSQSARDAGVSVAAAYDLKRRDPAFAAAWREALEAGFDAHISKPVALKSLLAVLRRLRG